MYSVKQHCDDKHSVCLWMFFFFPSWCFGSLQFEVFVWSSGALNQVPRCLEKLRTFSIFIGASGAVREREERPPQQTYLRQGWRLRSTLIHYTSLLIELTRCCQTTGAISALHWQITGTRGGLWNGSWGMSQFLSSSLFSLSFLFYCSSSCLYL